MTLKEQIYLDAVAEVQLLDEAQRALGEGDGTGATRSLDAARELLLRHAAPLPVAVVARLLKVSEPTVRDWLDHGLLDDAGRKPRAVTLESAARVHRLLNDLRERGHDGSLRAALLARLDDELTLSEERLQRSIAAMRRGRGIGSRRRITRAESNRLVR